MCGLMAAFARSSLGYHTLYIGWICAARFPTDSSRIG
jgi:hypothetical protein